MILNQDDEAISGFEKIIESLDNKKTEIGEKKYNEFKAIALIWLGLANICNMNKVSTISKIYNVALNTDYFQESLKYKKNHDIFRTVGQIYAEVFSLGAKYEKAIVMAENIKVMEPNLIRFGDLIEHSLKLSYSKKQDSAFSSLKKLICNYFLKKANFFF